MDKISFKNVDDNAEIYINDISLIDIIEKIEFEGMLEEERSDSVNIAGAYAFIYCSWLYYDLTKCKDWATVLACECGVPCCWDFKLSVIESEGKVYWLGFDQPYREYWTYDRLPYFEFDKKQYDSELRKLKKWANKYSPESVKYREKLHRKLISRRKSQKNQL